MRVGCGRVGGGFCCRGRRQKALAAEGVGGGRRPGCCRPGCCHPGCCRPGCCRPGCCRPSCCRPSCCRPSCCRPSCCQPGLDTVAPVSLPWTGGGGDEVRRWAADLGEDRATTRPGGPPVSITPWRAPRGDLSCGCTVRPHRTVTPFAGARGRRAIRRLAPPGLRPGTSASVPFPSGCAAATTPGSCGGRPCGRGRA